MRKSKIQIAAAVLAAAMLLGGCGEAPYELTEKEQSVIANYSAHAVSKFNRYQKEGLTYVERGTEETEAPAETEAVSPEPESTEAQTSGGESAAGAEAPPEENPMAGAAQSTLAEQFGMPGLEISYKGAGIVDSYVEEDYYAIYPERGNVYLALAVTIKNTGNESVKVDNLSKKAEFTALLDGSVTAKAAGTILPSDFSTFAETIAAGASRETVLLFEVPADMGSVEKLDLYVMIGENNYQIIL